MGDSSNDARIKTSLPNHPKMLDLEQRLGAEGAWAFIKLLLWVTDVHPSGSLAGVTDRYIELAVRWTGEPGELIAALREVKFLDGESGNYSIHEWAEHNHFVATKPIRQEAARRANDIRWNRTASVDNPKRIRSGSRSETDQNPRFASLRSVTQRSDKPPNKGKGLPSPDDFNPIEAARAVQIDLKIVGQRELNDIASVIEAAQRQLAESARTIAEKMVKQRQKFLASKPEKDFGAMWFFKQDGLFWLDESRWPKPSGAPSNNTGPPTRQKSAREKQLEQLVSDESLDPEKRKQWQIELTRIQQAAM